MKKIIGILFLAMVPFMSFAQEEDAQKNWAVVEFSTDFMREEPGYDKELGNQALMGTVVKVLDKKSYWYQIQSPEPYVAWATASGIVRMTEAEKDAYIAAPKYICTAEISHIFTKPSRRSERVCDFVMGDLVRQTGVAKGKWVKVLLPSGKEGWVSKRDVMDFARWSMTREVTGESILKLAKLYLGVPYMWGGNSIKHVDCSGLTRSVFFMHGVLLPRNASQQVKTGEEVAYEDAKPGDLVFFGTPATDTKKERVTHVTIYMGNDRIIHSASYVHTNSLKQGDEDYYGGTRLHVRRIIGNVDNGKGIVSIAKSPFYFKQ